MKNTSDRKNLFPKRLFLAVPLVLALVIVPYYLMMWIGMDFDRDFLRIDSCLDSGGSWDKSERVCRT